jgi:hypothetical protein
MVSERERKVFFLVLMFKAKNIPSEREREVFAKEKEKVLFLYSCLKLKTW